MTMEYAPGGQGRPELQCVGSVGGLAVHLRQPQADATLCRGLRGIEVEVGPGLPPFELNGCKRCAHVAAKAGYGFVIGFDGGRISL